MTFPLIRLGRLVGAASRALAYPTAWSEKLTVVGLLERAAAEARGADQFPVLATAHVELVTLSERTGDTDAALRNGLRAVEIEEVVGSPAGLMMAYAALGKAWRMNGDAARATVAVSSTESVNPPRAG